MLVNEYLSLRFGGNIKEKYNKLAFKEVLDNKEKYPLLVDFYDDMEDAIETNNFELGGFQDDDFDLEVRVEVAQQLLCAYLCVFAKKNVSKKGFLVQVIAGEKHLPSKNLEIVKDQQCLSIRGISSMSLTDCSIIREDYFFNQNSKHVKVFSETFYDDYDVELIKIQKAVLGDSFRTAVCMNFNNEMLHEEKLSNGETVYPVVYYEFIFKDGSVMPLYVTEKGFDPFNWINLDLKDIYKSKCLDNPNC